MMLVSGGVWADPVQVWVQPSGDSFAKAYALQNEARTYFGRAECNACGALEYKWDFSDGSSTGFVGAGNPRYLPVDGKSFAAFGTQWARLTVRDSADIANTASAQVDLQVIAAASDNLNRQKNSAIDRGLRWIYQNEYDNGAGDSSWGGVGYTGMALVAMENHGHNLQSPDSDIYKKSVRQGIQSLLNNASIQSLGTQKCIGDPEANDGDADADGKGILFGGDDLYQASIAVLGLVNSADKAFAQSYIVNTGNGLNGMTLFDVAVDAKDWLAWAQNDGDSGGEGSAVSCSYYDGGSEGGYGGAVEGYFNAWTDGGMSITDLRGYLYGYSGPVFGNNFGQYGIDWGDGTSETFTNVDELGWASSYNEPTLSYYDLGPGHTYATPGDYTIAFSYSPDGGLTNNALCTVTVTAVGGGQQQACGAAEAAMGAGGWRYGSNYGSADNSVTQWPVLALSEAKNRWDIDVNPEVITMLNHWLDYSQCADGSYGYEAPGSWCNYPKAAAGLIMLHYAGRPVGDGDVTSVLSYLDTNWNTSGYDWNFSNHYSMYGLFKALKVWGMTTLGGRNWEQEYDQNLITRQNSDGSWYDQGSWMDPSMSTFAAVAILAPEVASLPPVANAGGPYPSIAANQALQLVGSNSVHQDPAKHLVKYEWDFDASNGMWWDTLGTPPAGEGAVGINAFVSYADAGVDKSYTVTLRVTDDSTPTAERDTDTATVNVTSGNVPPVPVTNGPWTSLPGNMITFDASGSYDPNACTTVGNPACLGDSIASYEWDLDGDGNYNEANGDDGTPVTADRKIVQKSFANPISLPAKLRVTDTHGLQATSTDALNIVSIALVYGQQYDTCFRQDIDRFTQRLGIRVKFKNQGNAEAENVKMTLTKVPSNLTILKGVAMPTNPDDDMDAGEEWTTACDPVTKTADIELKLNRRIAPSGDWQWKAEFDFNGQHYTVTGIPPIGP